MWLALDLNPAVPNSWSIGYYTPAGVWSPIWTGRDKESAAVLCHYLNGGELIGRNFT